MPVEKTADPLRLLFRLGMPVPKQKMSSRPKRSKGEGPGASIRGSIDVGDQPQVPPLRYAPVGMTTHLQGDDAQFGQAINSQWRNKIVIPTGA